jgi:hypothetical protein
VIDPLTGIITLLPHPNFFFLGGQLTITVSDPSNAFDTKTVGLDIIPVNDAPYFTEDLDVDSIKVDSTVTGNIWELVEDVETPDDQLIITFAPSSSNLTVQYNDQTGDVALIPASGFTGNVDLVITVSDGDLSTSDTLLVVVYLPVGIADGIESGLPTAFDITQNYPNPFNPNTRVQFQLPNAADVRLTIYNVLGQRVRTLVNQRYEAGFHEVQWDGLSDVGAQSASGLYLYRFEAGGTVKILKMTLMK